MPCASNPGFTCSSMQLGLLSPPIAFAYWHEPRCGTGRLVVITSGGELGSIVAARPLVHIVSGTRVDDQERISSSDRSPFVLPTQTDP